VQNKYDQVPVVLLDRLKDILSFADIVADKLVADKLVCDEMDLLEDIIPRMYEVMHRVATFSCDSVKRTVGDSTYWKTIGEVDRELTRVVEDFGRAVNVEALHRTKETGNHPLSDSLPIHDSQQFHVEQQLLLSRLKDVKTDYDRDLCCMEGTRKSLLGEIIAWVTNGLEQTDGGNTYWIYGLPGIGKTSLAHSLCSRLHDKEQLAGAFFCQRDDQELRDPSNILPTLVHKLTILFPPFRRIVADYLDNDPNVTLESMGPTIFLYFIRKLPRLPKKTLVFVIDALDECGSTQSRPGILNALTEAASRAPWLKFIITSRPEVDIQRFFDDPTQLSHLRYDLASDNETTSDLRIFAEYRFNRMASSRCLQSPWPEPSLLHRVISQASGLFIFIETLALALEHGHEPTKLLGATSQDSSSPGMTSLYRLYSRIVRARRVQRNAEFRRMIGVLLATAPYRPLCEETIAELAGVRPDVVKMWVDDLGSILYRDEGASGGVRFRHLSISDFFVSDDCQADYQVNLQGANTELGIACLDTMVEQLRFNICELQDSRLANADVKDLGSRIKENISDALQYSSLYWSNHLCFTPDIGERRVWDKLRKFFEGPHALYWVEILSITGMLGIGVPSLRELTSKLVKVGTAPACYDWDFKVSLTLYRIRTRQFWKESRMFVVLCSSFALRSL